MALQGVSWPNKGLIRIREGPLRSNSGSLWLDMGLLSPKNRIYDKIYLWPTEDSWSDTGPYDLKKGLLCGPT